MAQRYTVEMTNETMNDTGLSDWRSPTRRSGSAVKCVAAWSEFKRNNQGLNINVRAFDADGKPVPFSDVQAQMNRKWFR